jgi:hypothetical protein
MIEIKSIDLTRLNVTMNRYVKELGLKSADVTFKTAGLLVRDLVTRSAPSNLARAQQRSVRFSKNVFNQARPRAFAFAAAQRGHGDLRWLSSGPDFLLGTMKESFQPQMSAQEAIKIYAEKAQPAGKKFGKSYERIGRRGKQAVMRLNRIVISRSALLGLQKHLKDNFGKLKASWAVGWAQLQVKGRLPSWVAKHIPKMRGRGLGEIRPNLKGDRPTITIISRASGCASQQSLQMIKGALRYRVEAMKRDIKLYAKGVKKIAGFKNWK